MWVHWVTTTGFWGSKTVEHWRQVHPGCALQATPAGGWKTITLTFADATGAVVEVAAEQLRGVWPDESPMIPKEARS